MESSLKNISEDGLQIFVDELRERAGIEIKREKKRLTTKKGSIQFL